MVKSFRRQGMDTASAISSRYRSLPKNHLGSVSTEMASAPASSYSLAICRYGKSGAMSPLEGEAFLHSQIKERPGFFNAFSKAKSPLGREWALRRISSAEISLLACAVRSLAWSASCVRMFALPVSLLLMSPPPISSLLTSPPLETLRLSAIFSICLSVIFPILIPPPPAGC